MKDKTKSDPWYFVYFGTFTIAFALRLLNIDSRAFWHDEIKYINIIQDYEKLGYFAGLIKWGGREFILTTIGYIFGFDSEFWHRFPVVLAGSFSVFYLYFISDDHKRLLPFALFLALSPIMVFWSTMARPYVFAGLFVILGWRWKWCYIVAILTTPFAVLGLNLYEFKKRAGFYVILVLSSFVCYKIGEFGSGHFSLEFLYHAKRLWVVVLISIGLHLSFFEFDMIKGLKWKK